MTYHGLYDNHVMCLVTHHNHKLVTWDIQMMCGFPGYTFTVIPGTEVLPVQAGNKK